MQDTTRATLEQFVEIAARLAGHRFTIFVRDHGLKLKLVGEAQEDGHTAAITDEVLPDTESIFAITPTIRRFIQNDPISFRNLRTVLDDSEVSQNWKEHFTAIRGAVNNYLDNPTPLMQMDDGAILTCRSIIDVFFNGDIIHGEEAKRVRLQEWKSNTIVFRLIRFHLSNIIAELSEAVFRLAYYTRLELEGVPVPPLVFRRTSSISTAASPETNSIFRRTRLKTLENSPNS